MREAISGNQSAERLSSVSVAISAHQCSSVLISGLQCSSVLISARRCPSVLISAHQCSSLVLTCGALELGVHRRQSEAIREAIRLVLTCGALQLGVHRRQVGAREEPGARLRAIVDDAIERAVPDEGGNQMRIRGKSEAINGHQRTHRPSEMR
jgi:hypothetical protein